MARTAKKLAQVVLGTTATAVYTAPVSTKTQITEVWIANTNATTARSVALYAHGTAVNNTLVPELSVAAKGVEIFHDSKIVIPAGEIFAAKQDAGTDVIMTIYGVEEA